MEKELKDFILADTDFEKDVCVEYYYNKKTNKVKIYRDGVFDSVCILESHWFNYDSIVSA